MNTFSRLAAICILSASFGVPLLAFAAGQGGASCTGTGQGTCDSGLLCVPGDYGSVCSFSSSGYVPPNSAPQNAAGTVNQQWVQYYRDTIVWAVNSVLVPILMAIAFVVFLFGVYKYFIWNGDSDTERETGRKFVLWGVIGFVVITSVWGLVNIVSQTLIPSTAGSTHPNYPTL